MGQQVGLFERRVVVRPISIVKTISKLTKSFTMRKFLAMFCLFIALFNEMDAKAIEGKPTSTLQVDCGEVGCDRVVSEREDPSSDDDDNNVGDDDDDDKDGGAEDNSDAEDKPPADGETEVKDEDALNGDAEQVEEGAPPEGDDVKEPEDAGAEVDEVAAEGENDDD